MSISSGREGVLVGQLPTNWARRTPKKTAIVFGEERISFQDFNDRVNRCAAFLAQQGLRKGDKVAVLSRNRPELLEILFAAAKSGITYVPMNFRLASVEINFVLRDSGAKLFLVSDVFDVARDPAVPVHRVSLDSEYAQARDAMPAIEPEVELSEHDMFAIFYTSGTTANPKGVVLTHANFVSNLVNEIIAYGMKTSDVCVHTLPLYHTAEASFALAQFYIGGTCVIVETYDASKFWPLVDREGITHTSLVFTMLLPLLDAYESAARKDTGTLRTLALGGQTTPVEVIRRAISLFGPDRLMIVYGLTESSPYLTYLSKEELSRDAGHTPRVASVGKEMFSCQVRVVDDRGNDVKPGEFGEIIGKGPNVMVGYYNRPDANEASLRNGWLHTGDVGTVDEDGFIYVVDRKKDLIISGGENIAPREVEDVVYRHPAIAECSVIGVPDAKWGEKVLAVVVAKPGMSVSQEELIDFCRRDLAGYKLPRSVVHLKALPKDPLGKIQKKVLREQFAKSS